MAAFLQSGYAQPKVNENDACYTQDVDTTCAFADNTASTTSKHLLGDFSVTDGNDSSSALPQSATQVEPPNDRLDQLYPPHTPQLPSIMDTSFFNFNPGETILDSWYTTSDEGIDLMPTPPSGQGSFENLVNPASSDAVFPCVDSYPGKSALAVPASSSDVLPQMIPDLNVWLPPTSPTIDNFGTAVSPNSSVVTDNQRWHATQSRLRAADRAFLYGVLTTKIYCRPSCASRRASRRHVRFFPFPGAIEAAEKTGLRPCKRCMPDAVGVKNTAVLGICEAMRLIITETFGGSRAGGKDHMKLESLAKTAGLSTFHFHRTFKATTQITPGDFTHACRSLALQDALGMDRSEDPSNAVDAKALLEHSACWSPRSARKALGGVTPTEYANGAPTVETRYCSINSPAGTLCVVLSPGKTTKEVRVHAVLLGQDVSAQAQRRFLAATASSQHVDRMAQHVREVEEESQDRDTEITADILRILWRARIWLKLIRHYGD